MKVLIADQSSLFAKLAQEKLEDEYDVKTCETGQEALKLAASFRPEIVVLDVTLSVEGGVTVLQTLSAADSTPDIIAMTYMTNERALMHLSQYDITCVLSKPCTIDLVVAQVRNIGYRLKNPLVTERPLKNEIDSLLISLGFRSGMNRYNCIAYAVLVRFNNPECAMKELYIDVAKKCGGTPQSVEKAIRDSIKKAYSLGNHSIWSYYFRMPGQEKRPCKGNSEFLACMVGCLNKRKSKC